ncbi:MAG TPA: hypothetical protein VGK00_04710 [Anaerolineales bacterium]|jgi:hypothetical protein
MSLPPQIFRFHDLAAVEVRSSAPFARDFFEAEYGYHRADESSGSLPRVSLDLQMDSSAPAGFTRHTHKLLARWSYRVEVLPGEVGLRVHANRAAVSMVHHMLVHPSLRWLAAGRGTLLLHAGAVVKNGKSLVFTGVGGAGKTTTTSLVLASGQGWQIHADDYVFLRPAQSLAYVTRSHLYRDLQNWVPAIRHRLTPWERLRLEFFGALREHSREGIKWPVRLGPQRMWPGITIANEAVPAAILLLERADIASPQLRPVENPADAANDLLEMNFGEARHFLSLLQKAGVLDERWLSAWKETERNLLDHLLSKTPTFNLALPLSGQAGLDTARAQQDLLNLLDGLVK